MAFVLADRVLETSTSTGTGSFVLAGARDGYQSFTDALANGDTTYYTITDSTDWEVGLGTWTESTATLARTTILSSSNSGSAVNFGAGTKDVFITYPASKFGQISEDTSPQLGGELDANGNNIRFGDDNPTYPFGNRLGFGAGTTVSGNNFPDMSLYHNSGNNYVAAYNGVIHLGRNSGAGGDAKLVLNGGIGAGGSIIELNSNATTVPQQTINAAQSAVDFNLQHNGSNKITLNTSGVTFNSAYTFPTADGTSGQVLTTDGSGNLSFTTVSGGSGIAAVVDDTSPQLGGDLDTNSNHIYLDQQHFVKFDGNSSNFYMGYQSYENAIYSANRNFVINMGNTGGNRTFSIANNGYTSGHRYAAVFDPRGSQRLYYSTSSNSYSKLTTETNGIEVQGDTTYGSAVITLNCEQNTHGVSIKAPPHSAAASYTLTLPSSVGSNGQVLTTDGSGGLSWATGGGGGGTTIQSVARSNRPSSPSAGTIIYNTTDNVLEFWNGSAWRELSSVAAQQAGSFPAAGTSVWVSTSYYPWGGYGNNLTDYHTLNSGTCAYTVMPDGTLIKGVIGYSNPGGSGFYLHTTGTTNSGWTSVTITNTSGSTTYTATLLRTSGTYVTSSSVSGASGWSSRWQWVSLDAYRAMSGGGQNKVNNVGWTISVS